MIACRFAADSIAKQQRPLTDSESRLLVEFLAANRRKLAGHYSRRYGVVCDDEIDDAFEDGVCRLIHVITRNPAEWTEQDFRDNGYRTAWRGMVGYRFALLALSRSGKGQRRIGCSRTRLTLSVSRPRTKADSGPGIYLDELRLGGAGDGLDWDSAWLDCIVDELADADRELLLAYYVEECRSEDIAARLGVRRNQVMHRLHAIVCRIRRELGLPAYDLADGERMSRGEFLTALGVNVRTLRKLQAAGLLAGLSLSPQTRYSQSDLDAAENAIAMYDEAERFGVYPIEEE